MADTFQIPMRVLSNGSLSSIDNTSDDCVNQDIAAAVLTHRGERLLFPAFGIPDPAFASIEPAELQATIAAYGPKVRVTSVATTVQTADYQEVQLNWDRGANGKS